MKLPVLAPGLPRLALGAILLSLLVVQPSAAATRDAVPAASAETEADRWRLDDLYSGVAAWQADAAEMDKAFARFAACRGTLAQGPARLADCLAQHDALVRRYYRMAVYAGELYAGDTSSQEALALDQKSDLIGNAVSDATAWVDPEILAIGAPKVEAWLAAEPALATWRYPLREVLRRAPHTRSADEETLIAAFGPMADAGKSVNRILANAELPWPTIELADGRKVRLDAQGYESARQSADRADRKRAMDAFFGSYKGFEGTFGVTLYAQMKQESVYAGVRKYPDSISAALDASGVPVAVYDTLIAETDRALPTLHRYFRLRARMLGVEHAAYYDIYPPLVQGDFRYTLEDAKRLTLDAVAPLGADYVDALRRGFASRWMDAYARPHKLSGAHMAGAAYDVHPYVLANFAGDYEGVTTIAHEWGHAMHSYFSTRAQPFATADYATFVAEIASTFNESMLLDRMLAQAKTDDEKLYYLGTALENLRGTFFRQAMFAEFERQAHARVDRGDPMTGADFTKLYCEILKRYHGAAEGVMAIDDAYCVEWAFIPHFYNAFYVYQYATSIAASALFAQRVGGGDKDALARYRALLAAGGSDNPYELVRRAGVDLASPEPYRALAARMNDIMDRIEAILDARKKR